MGETPNYSYSFILEQLTVTISEKIIEIALTAQPVQNRQMVIENSLIAKFNCSKAGEVEIDHDFIPILNYLTGIYRMDRIFL